VDDLIAAWIFYCLAAAVAYLAASCAPVLTISGRMSPVDLRILEVPDISVASHFHRNRIKKKNKRARAQLLLVSSVLDADAVAELVDQERRRVAAARAAPADRAAVLALADHERLRAGCSVPAAPHSASVDAADVSDLAKRILRESRDQSDLERQVVARLDAGPRRAPPRRPPSPEPPGRTSLVPRPAREPQVCEPAAAPDPRSAHYDRLEVIELRRAVASLEADREEKHLRLRLLESSAHLAPRVEATPADQLLPGGISVAQALAEKDACIAQLRFEIADRSGRRLEDRISLASAFVHNPANCFAPPPSAGTVAERASPWSRGPFPLPGGRSPLPSPPPTERPPLLFSWGLGLARCASSQDQLGRLARSANADTATPAGARAPRPLV
jgi:hypothetical protein